MRISHETLSWFRSGSCGKKGFKCRAHPAERIRARFERGLARVDRCQWALRDKGIHLVGCHLRASLGHAGSVGRAFTALVLGGCSYIPAISPPMLAGESGSEHN